MNNLTPRPPRSPLTPPPSFDELEQDIPLLQSARELAATSQVASPELLAALDRSIAAARHHERVLVVATAPAPPGIAGAYLLLLTRAYPNSGQQDGQAFGRLLLEDVLSLRPCTAAVDIACRKWRRSNKFLPAISELMGEIRATDLQLRGLFEFIGRLQGLRDRTFRELGGS